MDNASRSQRTRDAAIRAALAIISRDGASHLTLDAIVRESGLSKGALTHQFPTKKAVLKALLEHQMQFFENFSRTYLAEHGLEHPQPHLAAQIATLREALADPNALFFALLGAMAEEPALLSVTRAGEASKLKAIKAEAADPDLAILRWFAARGLTLSGLFGLSPLSERERERMFALLLDDAYWHDRAQSPSKARDRRSKPANARR